MKKNSFESVDSLRLSSSVAPVLLGFTLNIIGSTAITTVENWSTKMKDSIGHFLSIKTDVLQIFSFITGDKNEFLSPMVFSN